MGDVEPEVDREFELLLLRSPNSIPLRTRLSSWPPVVQTTVKAVVVGAQHRLTTDDVIAVLDAVPFRAAADADLSSLGSLAPPSIVSITQTVDAISDRLRDGELATLLGDALAMYARELVTSAAAKEKAAHAVDQVAVATPPSAIAGQPDASDRATEITTRLREALEGSDADVLAVLDEVESAQHLPIHDAEFVRRFIELRDLRPHLWSRFEVRLASSATTPREFIEHVARDRTSANRSRVLDRSIAGHVNAPEGVLFELVGSHPWQVYGNPSCPRALIEAAVRSPQLAPMVIGNPGLRPSDYRALLALDSASIHAVLLTHPDVPAWVRAEARAERAAPATIREAVFAGDVPATHLADSDFATVRLFAAMARGENGIDAMLSVLPAWIRSRGDLRELTADPARPAGDRASNNAIAALERLLEHVAVNDAHAELAAKLEPIREAPATFSDLPSTGNCVHNTIAVAMTLNGIPVGPMPRAATGGTHQVVDDFLPFAGDPVSAPSLRALAAALPVPGDHAVVVIDPRGVRWISESGDAHRTEYEGHAFNAVNVDGNVVFVDNGQIVGDDCSATEILTLKYGPWNGVKYAVVRQDFDHATLFACERAAAALPGVIAPREARSFAELRAEIAPVASTHMTYLQGDQIKELINAVEPGEAVLVRDTTGFKGWLFEGTDHGVVIGVYAPARTDDDLLVRVNVSAVPYTDSPGRFLQVEQNLGSLPQFAWLAAGPKRMLDHAPAAVRGTETRRGILAAITGRFGR